MTEGREADGSAAIIREDEEGRPARTEDRVRGDAVEDGAHAVLADVEADVSARVVARVVVVVARLEVADVVEGRAVEVGAAPDEQGDLRAERLQDVLPGLACRDLAVGRERRDRREE